MRQIATHLDYAFYLLAPSVSNSIKSIRRAGQIVYPKDSGYALLRMNMHSGKRVIEAGPGSGALAIALAQAVMPDGHAYSCDAREDMQQVAAKNLDRWGLLPFVTLKQRNIAEGFDERNVGACFLDIGEPWRYLHSVLQALRPDGATSALSCRPPIKLAICCAPYNEAPSLSWRWWKRGFVITRSSPTACAQKTAWSATPGIWCLPGAWPTERAG